MSDEWGELGEREYRIKLWLRERLKAELQAQHDTGPDEYLSDAESERSAPADEHQRAAARLQGIIDGLQRKADARAQEAMKAR